MKGAYYTKQYRNVFAECGYTQEEIDKEEGDKTEGGDSTEGSGETSKDESV